MGFYYPSSASSKNRGHPATNTETDCINDVVFPPLCYSASTTGPQIIKELTEKLQKFESAKTDLMIRLKNTPWGQQTKNTPSWINGINPRIILKLKKLNYTELSKKLKTEKLLLIMKDLEKFILKLNKTELSNFDAASDNFCMNIISEIRHQR